MIPERQANDEFPTQNPALLAWHTAAFAHAFPFDGTSAPSNGVMLTVSLSRNAGSGGTPTGDTLFARVTPGSAPIVSVPLTGTSASFSSVPPGTYYLRLTASNASGTSASSAQVTLTVP